MSSEPRVTRLTPEYEDAYDSFIASHPRALAFYTRRYRDFLCELLSCRARYAVALRGEELVGVLPLMETDGPYGRVLNSLPYFGSNGGSLANDAEAEAALTAWYEHEVSGGAVAAATLIENHLAPVSAPPPHDLVTTRTAHVTSLPTDPTESELLKVVHKSRRRNVQKAKRLGTEVVIDNDDLGTLETLHRQSMNSIGAAVKEPAFFAALPRHFVGGTDYEIFIARRDGAPSAALLVFYVGHAVDYYMPAVSPAARSDQPLALILVRAMLRAAERGHRHWNWGGSPPDNQTLQQFKQRWGGTPLQYRYWTKLNETALLEATAEELRSGYPGFFVLPYDQLHTDTDAG